MANDVTNIDDGNKAVELSNPGKLLKAYMQATGIHCAKTLADSLGIKLRTIQRLKLEIATCANDAKCAISGAANSANDAINGVSQQSDGKKVSPTPPSKNNYNLELPSNSNSSVAARDPRVAAAPLMKIDLAGLAEKVTEACNGSLASQAIAPGLASMSTPLMWIEQGADLDRDVIPTLTALGKKYHGKGIRSWDYFTGPIAEAKARRERGLPAVTLTDKPQTGYRMQPPPLIPFNDTIVQSDDLDAFARSCLVE